MKTATARPRKPAAAPTGLFSAPEPRKPPPPPAAAPETRPRWTNIDPIPLIGGEIPPGTLLIETARIPAQTIRVPVGFRDWEDKLIGERANLLDPNGRSISDYPLDRLAEHIGIIERI